MSAENMMSLFTDENYKEEVIFVIFYGNKDEIKKMMFAILLAFLFVKLSMEFPSAILKAIKT